MQNVLINKAIPRRDFGVLAATLALAATKVKSIMAQIPMKLIYAVQRLVLKAAIKVSKDTMKDPVTMK